MNSKITAVADARASKSKTVTSEPTTTMRVSVEMHEKLKRVAEMEHVKLIALTEEVLKDVTQRYEAISGKKLTKQEAPKNGLAAMGLLGS